MPSWCCDKGRATCDAREVSPLAWNASVSRVKSQQGRAGCKSGEAGSAPGAGTQPPPATLCWDLWGRSEGGESSRHSLVSKNAGEGVSRRCSLLQWRSGGTCGAEARGRPGGTQCCSNPGVSVLISCAATQLPTRCRARNARRTSLWQPHGGLQLAGCLQVGGGRPDEALAGWPAGEVAWGEGGKRGRGR